MLIRTVVFVLPAVIAPRNGHRFTVGADRFWLQAKSVIRHGGEKLPEPDHVSDPLARGVEVDRCPLFSPIEQHAKKAARHILDARHVDADACISFATDQARQCLTQQREIGAIPDLHRSQVDLLETVLGSQRHLVLSGHFTLQAATDGYQPPPGGQTVVRKLKKTAATGRLA